MSAKTKPSRLSEDGYTIAEALTVTAVIGALIATATPAALRFKASHEVQPGISQVAGMLRATRAKAIADGLPRLVLFEKEEIVDGERSTFARIVVDHDRSYSVSAPDEVEAFSLDAGLAPQVTQYGLDGATPPFDLAAATVASVSASALDGDYIDLLGDYTAKMADGDSSGDYSDVMAMYEDKAEDWQSGGNPGCSGPGPCLDPGHADYEPALDPTSGSYDPQAVLDLLNGTYTGTATGGTSAWMNGTSFPVSDTEDVPAIAFNERGIPVALDAPTAWGTGAGGVYLTDNRYAVYAAFVSPLGEISERRFDPETNTWR